MVHRERKTLWNLKRLSTKFRGDDTWIPCEIVESSDDAALFGSTLSQTSGPLTQLLQENTNGEFISSGRVSAELASGVIEEDQVQTLPSKKMIEVEGPIRIQSCENSTVMEEKNDLKPKTPIAPHERKPGDSEVPGNEHSAIVNDPDILKGEPCHSSLPKNDVISHDGVIDEKPEEMPDTYGDAISKSEQLHQSGSSDDRRPNATNEDPTDSNQQNNDIPETKPDLAGDSTIDDSQPAPHRMTTRAKAHAASSATPVSRTRTPSTSSSTPPYIHPLFLLPPSAHPDRDLGLPAPEADDMRRVLMSYVQKQEEVCRGAEKLYEGLLRADRMRKTVMKWCKAEGHIGEASDGEDWYDREEWGLSEDLKKGGEEEEDEATVQSKRTRGRRA